MNSALPTGTVTFLFTDIQGSTPLWEQMPQEMEKAVAQHHAILRQAIESNGGAVVRILGDSFESAFRLATQALSAAIAAQRQLQSTQWGATGALEVRMGLHTGPAELDPKGNTPYAASHTLNRTARIMSAGHGGQILLSEESADLVRRALPEGVLIKDLGEYQLKGLSNLELIYQVCAPGLPENFPPLKSDSRSRHNLPPELTPFIGRENEIAQVRELLHEHRLVTLTGSGGVGKTRLSLQVARASLEAFPDGVWFVELAPLVDPNLLPLTVATVLGLREEPGRPIMESLSDFLKKRQALIVLDNCEHLLSACALLADNLIRQTQQVCIFCSSRENLGVSGETAYRVPSLAVPDPLHMPALIELQDYEAVRLFTERGRTVLPAFQVDAQNASTVVQICRRLDGIPLALELAAARLNMLTTEQLASRLNSAFRLLTGGNRTALPRQQTLRATIDWSYQLLSTSEQLLLQRLAVFQDGGTLETIEVVCSGKGLEGEEILDLLSGLFNKSIVIVEREQHVETRYRLLETVRQYAREKLFDAGESTLFYDRHLAYFLALAEDTEPKMRTPEALDWLTILIREFGNFRAALSWALDGDENPNVEAGLRLACALLELWHTEIFHSEGYSWLNKGLSALVVGDQLNDAIRFRAYFAAGHLILPIGRLEEACQYFQKCLELAQKNGDIKSSIMAQSMLGESLAWQKRYPEAQKLCHTSLEKCRPLGDQWLLAWALCRLGLTYLFHDENLLAKPFLEESLSIFEKIGDRLQVSDIFITLGMIAFEQGEYVKSQGYLMKCLNSGRARHSKWTAANALDNLGKIAYMHGDFHQMRAYADEGTTLKRETGSFLLIGTLLLLGIAELRLAHLQQASDCFQECMQSARESYLVVCALVGMAGVAVQSDQLQVAATLLGAVSKLCMQEFQHLDTISQIEFERIWREVVQKMGEHDFKNADSKGQEMTLEQAQAFALEIISMINPQKP
jgi:predicted ATPase/class 3 adenylate cyclase